MSEPKPSVVLFVNDVSRIAEFYRELAGMSVLHAEPDHAVLAVGGMELVVHALPSAAPIPGSVGLREDSYLKLCLPVGSIATARAVASQLGGAIASADLEWEARGFRACDGHDPEGNVLQVRESATGPASR